MKISREKNQIWELDLQMCNVEADEIDLHRQFSDVIVGSLGLITFRISYRLDKS